MARGLTSLLLVASLLAGCAGAPRAQRAASTDAGALLAIDAAAAEAYAQGRHADAAEGYLQLVRERPQDAGYWYRLGNALVNTGAFDDAAVAYLRAVAIEPGNARAWHNLGVVRVQQAQAALAGSVQHADPGGEVFNESLKLSTGLYSLVKPVIDRAPPSEAPASAVQQGDAP